jgi:transcriptional regulator with XRE-family HTH domain
MKSGLTAQRLTVINPVVLAHMLDHPARGSRWTVRELATVTGRSHSLIGHIRSGERRQVDPELARQIAEAVGCHVANLFMLGVSTFVDNSEDVA